MPIHNSDVERMFHELADLLDIAGDNPYRVRAYRNAARTVSGLSHSVTNLVQEQVDLSQYSGIGKDLAAKIQEIVTTGRLTALDQARQQVNPGLRVLLSISGLGPKRVKTLSQELHITSLQDLQQAAEEGRIQNISGFGPKMEQSILEEIHRHSGEEKRFKLATVDDVAGSLHQYLASLGGVGQVTVAGSYRRRKETVGDLDILVTAPQDSGVTDRFVAFEDVQEIISHGETRSSVLLRSGLQVDLRVIPEASYGAALHYFTGSKAHNIAIRKMGLDRGYKINEYGIFQNNTFLAGRTEEEVYAYLDLAYIPPELREDRGEIQAAQEGRLPHLISARDIRGDLHLHTHASDGQHSVRRMAEAGLDMGYQYLAITDHSQSLGMARGLDPDRLLAQIEEIEVVNREVSGITLLKGSEVDILDNGDLDLPDWILDKLDLCVCAVHSKFKLPKDQQTERILRAMRNPHFSILAHPSGRLIGDRPGYELDMERILQGAQEHQIILELNSQPERLDLTDQWCRAAKDLGLEVAISTDAHRTADLRLIRFGLDQARRGWLESKDVVNTLPLNDFKARLRR